MQTDNESGQAGAELLDTITALRAAARDLEIETRQAQQGFAPDFERLRRTVGALGRERAARPPVCPDARAQWNDFLAGKRENIEPRAVRFLCWEPDVATDQRFQDYLDRSARSLRARVLQGLVRSCHARWSRDLCANGGVVNRVRGRVERYDGANRILTRWRAASDAILTAEGPGKIATGMVENPRAIKDECTLWTLEESSAFVLDFVRRATRRCHDQLGPQSAANQFLLRELLPWSRWPIEEFKREVATAIVHPAIGQVAELVDGLKRFVLQDDRLRDPRLPSNARNWLGVPDEARQRFIQWLSRDDIEFFFEHVLPRGTDPHGRKAFWLRYVRRVLMSRPLLNWRDQTKLQARMAQLHEQVGNYGRISGVPDTSAFLLDFGRVVVVEFSQVGNACYVYEKAVARQLIPDFWSTEPFGVSGRMGLKQPLLAVERVRHVTRVTRWENTLANILARYGVRPLSKDEQ